MAESRFKCDGVNGIDAKSCGQPATWRAKHIRSQVAHYLCDQHLEDTRALFEPYFPDRELLVDSVYRWEKVEDPDHPDDMLMLGEAVLCSNQNLAMVKEHIRALSERKAASQS